MYNMYLKSLNLNIYYNKIVCLFALDKYNLSIAVIEISFYKNILQ